ncbi:MAG TPA: hypothetical protein VM261_33170 [Kofleriaceae bacterium]|nr:hypothetical protein [Kofleriaceae bacterium]
MTRTSSLVAGIATLVALPALVLAQPTPPPEPPPPQPETQTLSPDEVRAIADEAAAAAVAAERARVAAEAAAQAPAETAPVEPPAADEGETYLTGDGGFTDVRLNFTLTNENVLAKPGETIPSVPGWRFGRPNSLGTLFFDNYDTRFSGYETLSHAIMYRNYRKDHLEVEGAFVLRINEVAERKIDLSDAGSYILVSWWKDPTRKNPERITLTTFPVSSDRMRLGYSYRLSWGGNEEYRRSSQSIPGFKLQYDTGKAYAFVGAKGTVLLDSATAEQVAKLGFLGGAGVDLSEQLRLEVNGGYFNRGSNELEDVNNEDVQLYGVSAQIAAHQGMPVASSIDYKLYKYDPERIGRVFQKAKYPGGTSWLAMAEATYLGQTLKHPERSGSTTVQSGLAGDVNVRMMMDRIRLRLDVQYRDLAFLLHSVPSLPTYSDFPQEYEITPNFFAAVGADQNFEDRLTLGVVVGVELPATLTSPTGIPGDTTMGTGRSTYVIRNNGGNTLINVLPDNEKVAASFAVKGSGQLDFGDIYAALVDVYYVYDPNQTRYRRGGPEDLFEYQFGEFNQLGVNVTLQAKF